MERQSDSMLPNSLSDADLASSYSEFFSEKMKCIWHKLDLDLRPCIFSVDFNARPRMITTITFILWPYTSAEATGNNQRNKENLLFSGSK